MGLPFNPGAMFPVGRNGQRSAIRTLFSGGLAVLLAGLGMFVRSESAHDAFHVKPEPHVHASDHSHHHHHGHSHDHDHSVPHEHTSPLIDLLAEEHLLCGSLVVAASHELSFDECELPARDNSLTPTVAVSQPPGRAPPICVVS